MDTDEKLLARFILGHTSEVAQKIGDYPEREIAALLESCSIELSALLLGQMDRFIAARSLEKVDLKIAVQFLEKMPISTAEVLLRQIDYQLCDSIIKELPKQISTPIRQILKYPKNSIGAFINPGVFVLYGDKTIKEGLEKIKKINPEIGAQIFILNRHQSLTGFIELHQLITNDVNKQISSIVKNRLPKILADMNISALSEVWKNNEFFSHLPVVNSEGTFLGVIGKDLLNKSITGKSNVDLHARKTSNALSELYKIGLSSLFLSTAEIVGNNNLK